jgi:hypothetical protein
VAVANGEKAKAAALASSSSTSRLYKVRQIAPLLAARLKGGIITSGDPNQSPLSMQYWLNLVLPANSPDNNVKTLPSPGK